jgi:hypothetical protein
MLHVCYMSSYKLVDFLTSCLKGLVVVAEDSVIPFLPYEVDHGG